MRTLDTAYRYGHSAPNPSHAYLWAAIRRELAARSDQRVFDLGCGNGATARMLAELGYRVTGVDPSEEAIGQARQACPEGTFAVGDASEDLAAAYGRFPCVVCLEVVEHCFDPLMLARTFRSMVADGGIGLLSTPYHGYAKNLALSLAGRWDKHFSALWRGGHIKFFSKRTLSMLLHEAGFTDVRFLRVGRVPALAKSMMAVCR